MKEILNLPCSTFGVGYIHDVEFKRVPTFPKGTGISSLKRSLYMQYLFPSPTDKKDCGPYPIVLFVPGGAWRTPQVYFRVPFLVPLARRGILVAMADYRGCELFTCEDAISDVRSALRYTRIHAAEYGGDPDNIFLMGESAGAHLSMMAVCGGEAFDDPADDLEISAGVCGVLELYGPTDSEGQVSAAEFKALPDEQALASPYAMLARGCPRDKFAERLAPLSPLRYVREGVKLPPLLMAHGEDDKLVPVEQAEAMYEALVAAGRMVEYSRLQNAGHGNWRFYDDTMMDKYAMFIQKHKRR